MKHRKTPIRNGLDRYGFRPFVPSPWPTEAQIMAAQTEAGGWTRKTLAQWGVPWPPPRGWKYALLTHDERFFRRLQAGHPGYFPGEWAKISARSAIDLLRDDEKPRNILEREEAERLMHLRGI